MRFEWLKKQLTAAKQAAPMWAELADTVQELFEQQVEPIIDRLRGMTSAFTMTEEDLEKRINELGPFFFLSDRVSKDDWPLALMQRQDEIHLKKTDYPLVSTIAREFTGMQVAWMPLYAPIDQKAWPYGTRFTTKEYMPFENIPEDGWFMTARGVIRLPINQLSKSFPNATTVDEQTTEFERILRRFITPLIPLHIVFDGAQYFISYTLLEAEEWAILLSTDITQTCPPAVERKEVLDPAGKTEVVTTFPPANNPVPYTHSFRARFDAFPMDAWTIDKPLPGAPE